MVIHRFSVGRLSCAVVSDGQMEPPWEPPMAEFFRPECGVPSQERRDAVAIDGLGIEPLVGRLGDRLVTANAPASELAAVVFTHLHQDHARGAIWSGNLTFPSAFGFAHAAEIAFWSANAESPSDDPHRAEAIEALRLFGTRMRPFAYESEILPGIHTVAAAGHTPGHTAILLESQGERLLCVGDSFYDPLQVSHPRWCTPWDNDPARAIVSRETVLARAADEQLLVHAYHMPFPGLGHVEREGDTYKWVPARRE